MSPSQCISFAYSSSHFITTDKLENIWDQKLLMSTIQHVNFFLNIYRMKLNPKHSRLKQTYAGNSNSKLSKYHHEIAICNFIVKIVLLTQYPVTWPTYQPVLRKFHLHVWPQSFHTPKS